MKKLKVILLERVMVQREMVIEVPKSMTDEELNRLFIEAESTSTKVSEVPYAMQAYGNVKVLKYPEDVVSPGEETKDVEVVDYDYEND